MGVPSGKIDIYIQPGQYSSEYDYRCSVDFDELWVGEVFTNLDEPSPDACGLSKALCHSVSYRKGIIKKRIHMAQELAQMLTEKIMESFEQKDMVNGYDKKEWEAFHRGE